MYRGKEEENPGHIIPLDRSEAYRGLGLPKSHSNEPTRSVLSLDKKQMRELRQGSPPGARAIVADGRSIGLAENVTRAHPSLDAIHIAGRETFEYSIEAHGNTQLDSALDPDVESDNIAWIIHSSGMAPDLTAKNYYSDIQGQLAYQSRFIRLKGLACQITQRAWA